ncbi:MAG: transporter [Cyanobacteria bacterium P01_F01_bin.53]
MSSKLSKSVSFLAGLFLATYGAAVGAETTVENLSSGDRSDEQVTLATADSVADSVVAEAPFLAAPTNEVTTTIERTASTRTNADSIERASLDDSYARLQALLNDGDLSDTDPSEFSVVEQDTQDALDSVPSSLADESISGEVALSTERPTEEIVFQSEEYSPIDVALTGIESLEFDSFSADSPLGDPVFSPVLIGDGGAPHFEDAILWSPSRPDSHAPIGVMGDHTHGKGEFMLSYRYMYMDMDGNRSGTNSLSTADVLQDFMVTPVRMTMQMHMLGAMYAPTDDLTLMAMLPYVTKEMDHLTRMGVEFTTNSEGIGDVGLGGLYTILDRNRQRVHLNLGFTFPTGSINERDDTPAGPDQILPYPMQIGSGTVDLRPGVTYLGQAGRWSWGSQASGIIRLGENGNGYRQGNQLMITGWGARSWNDWFSTSLRLNGRTWGDYSGQDARLNPNVIPTADPDRRAGTQLDVGLGLNFYVPEGGAQGLRLATEFNLPVFRSLSGPQLETDFSATAGVQYAF